MTKFQKKVCPAKKFKNKRYAPKRLISGFSNGVYNIVRRIPRGSVLTYKQVAIKLGNAKLARAVGNALKKNYDSKVPCHRVIRADGKIGGYRAGAKKKEELLKKEGYLK